MHLPLSEDLANPLHLRENKENDPMPKGTYDTAQIQILTESFSQLSVERIVDCLEPFIVAHFRSVNKLVFVGLERKVNGQKNAQLIGNIPVRIIPVSIMSIERPILAGVPRLVVKQGAIFCEREVSGLVFLLVVGVLLCAIVVWCDARLETRKDLEHQHCEGHYGYYEDDLVGEGVVEEFDVDLGGMVCARGRVVAGVLGEIHFLWGFLCWVMNFCAF